MLERLYILFLTLAVSFVLVACSENAMVGNGGGYVGGDGESTLAQVQAEFGAAKKDFTDAVKALNDNVGWDWLYAHDDCDPGLELCKDSSPMSLAKRRYTRELILKARQFLYVHWVTNPVPMELVDELPEVTDADGHVRDPDAVTKLEVGSKILLLTSAFKKHPVAELRGLFVQAFLHELLHQYLGLGDNTALEVFLGKEGARECLTFAGVLFRDWLYFSAPGASASEAIAASSSIRAIPSDGLPDGGIMGTPAVLFTAHETSVFVTSTTGAVYRNQRTADGWTGYVALTPNIYSQKEVSVAATDANGGYMLASVESATIAIYECRAALCTRKAVGPSPSSPAKAVASAPRLVLYASTSMLVYFVGGDGYVYGTAVNQMAEGFNRYSIGPTEQNIAFTMVPWSSVLVVSVAGSAGEMRSGLWIPTVGWYFPPNNYDLLADLRAATAMCGDYSRYVLANIGERNARLQDMNARAGTRLSLKSISLSPTEVPAELVSDGITTYLYELGLDGTIYEVKLPSPN